MTTYAPVNSVEELEDIYGEPGEASLLKVADRITPQYRRFLEASPFFTLATAGPEGLDCSPRGELGGAFRILDDKTIAIPDRRGNNRIDSLRNIVRDPRVGLLFLVPGSVTTIRLNGTAIVTVDPDLLASFEKDGKQPRSVVLVRVGEIYTQCGRAILRSKLWDPAHHADPASVPTAGDILREQSNGAFDSETYDKEWAGRAAKTMW
ncbi:pyridoxamine 5'-phosphate oxidase family protein [Oricola thermophila]|uniref:Pyridoxamine 5'-phosphate oxidase family protein n=1 Tax=Oricola thermophila TaxID=2742145 RepID=A0A6N1V9P6_9HYPH|nr:pyridoxamine 5'-phosphate oxidase family protein [Oricola thermophila]QKV17650.1 pyridoxamine 5'-phosphate oxidase family protein [Oricola thermophila]